MYKILIKTIFLISFLDLFFTFVASVSQRNINSSLQNSLPCRLEWVSFHRGNPIPKNFIPINLDANSRANSTSGVPIGRQKLLGLYALGSVDGEFVGHFIQKHPFQLWNYEILTNPLSCFFEFVPSTNSSPQQFGVSISNTSKTEGLGRVYNIEQDTWFPCTIKDGLCSFVDPKRNQIIQKSNVFQRLISYSPGLTMNLRNLSFKVEKDNRNRKVVGLDIIRNKGDATLRKSLVHTKTVIKTLNWNFGFTFRFQIGLSLNIMKNWLMPRAPDLAVYLAYGETHTWHNSRIIEERITISKDIDIPARTSVECKSTVVMRTVTLNVEGEAVFSAIGHTGEEVVNLLRNSGEEGPFSVEGNNVVVKTNATFHGTAPSQDEFLVRPYNSLIT